ncbi:MAG: hypothetical protein JNK58_01410 [Phycisphaerae bacterium]|nr:hypothetical protein [Phycisphaerae bacterium]
MFSLPPLPPSWDGFHPLVVHFPIALLLSAPVLVLMGLLVHRHRHGLNVSALVLMLMGTIGVWLSLSTGESAEEWVDEVGAVKSILHDHEEMAEKAWIASIVATVVFAAYTAVPWMMKREVARKWTLLAGALFLAGYVIPCLAVANTAHLGGRLVHEQGVRGRLTAGGVAESSGALPREREEDEGH